MGFYTRFLHYVTDITGFDTLLQGSRTCNIGLFKLSFTWRNLKQ